MSAASIQAKLRKGLARAVSATGSTSSALVYLLSKSTTAGTPLAPGTTTTTNVLLVNAIFKEYSAKTFDDTILAGDRQLVCSGDVVIKQGDIIQQGGATYIVKSLKIKAPTSDVLQYIAQVRLR